MMNLSIEIKDDCMYVTNEKVVYQNNDVIWSHVLYKNCILCPFRIQYILWLYFEVAGR
jgi:hypothetical protein